MEDRDDADVVITEPARTPFARGGPVSFAFGVVIGVAAGLIGVGGGEFRIPVLLYALRLPIKVASGVNMVIGLFTVTLSVARRWGHQTWTSDALTLATVMGAASVLGSVIGARQAHRIPTSILKTFVISYLLVVGVWMVVEAFLHAEYAIINPHGPARWIVAALAGFAIAAVSGSLGVAGGEMRIPALMYLFALPIKEAGRLHRNLCTE